MKTFTLALEIDKIFYRAGVIKDKRLIDLAVDRLDQPLLYRSTWRGRVERLIPPKSAFVTLGQRQAYLEDSGILTSGLSVAVELTALRGEGKADSARLRPDIDAAGEPGLIAPGWDAAQRLLDSCRPDEIVANPAAAARLKTVCPSLMPKVRLDEQPFELLGLEEEWENLQHETARLANGASLIIQSTAALTAIDVNTSGNTALDTAEAALTAIARQLRLRNVSGIVLIDLSYIKPRSVLEELARRLVILTRDDPAGVKITGLTPLGLIELTRRRRDFPLSEILKSVI